MSAPDPASLSEVQRRSRQAALMSLGGLIFIGGTMAWSFNRLRVVNTEVAAKEALVAQSEQTIKALSEDQHRLLQEKITLAADTQRLAEQLAGEKVEAEKLAASNRQLTVQAGELQQKQAVLTAAVADAQASLAAVEQKAAAMEQVAKERLATLQGEMQGVEADLQRKKAELLAKQQELASYEKQYTIANEQWKQTLQVARREVSAAEAPITVLAQPKASARKVGSNQYECFIWIDVPEKRRSEIKSVSYVFNHPSFSEQVMRSDNAAENFTVGYRGWGALRLVIITIELRAGGKHEIAFDMAQALGLAGRANSGGKVPIDPAFTPNNLTPANVKIPIRDLTPKPPGG